MKRKEPTFTAHEIAWAVYANNSTELATVAAIFKRAADSASAPGDHGGACKADLAREVALLSKLARTFEFYL